MGELVKVTRQRGPIVIDLEDSTDNIYVEYTPGGEIYWGYNIEGGILCEETQLDSVIEALQLLKKEMEKENNG